MSITEEQGAAAKQETVKPVKNERAIETISETTKSFGDLIVTELKEASGITDGETNTPEQVTAEVTGEESASQQKRNEDSTAKEETKQESQPVDGTNAPVEEGESSDGEVKKTPALASQGGREVSKTILYVGGLFNKISEEILANALDTDGIDKVNILADKNSPGGSFAFVEFADETVAKATFEKFTRDQLIVEGRPAVINWAYQSQQARHDPDAINVFVGDLSTEINDETLKDAFSLYPSVLQAHVMWDMQTGHSRGYGFVSFGNQKDAEEAIAQMSGHLLAGRAIRLNWAHKQQNRKQRHHHHNNAIHHHHSATAQYFPPSPVTGDIPLQPLQPYDIVLRKAPAWQTTVYVGNLVHFTRQEELVPLLQNFGFIVDLKLYPDRGCAFVKYDSHERAAVAIIQLDRFMFNGRPLKVGWGREKHQNFQVYGQ